MTMLGEIQAAATDSSTSVGVVLRKCLVLAARLRHNDLREWAERELNGYPRREEVTFPPYRLVHSQSFGNFSGMFGRSLHNAPIPLTCIPEPARSRLAVTELHEPVTTYESLLAASQGASLRIPWAPELVVLVAAEIYEDMNCLQAWRMVPAGALVTLLENVRNRVLSMALQIEADYPHAGELEGSDTPPASKVSQVFQTYIMGSVQNWATASSDFSQVSVSSSVQQASFESLSAVLAGAQVPPEDISELREALKAEPTPPAKGQFGPRVSRWLGSMVVKAGQGAWKVTTDVGAKLLTEALLAYYGLK